MFETSVPTKQLISKVVSVIILAGGRGTRMGSGRPKALRLIAGRPIIFWTLDTLEKLGIMGKNIVTVTGFQSSQVEKTIMEAGYQVRFVRQRVLLGTAHAVRVGLRVVSKDCKIILVLFSDDSALYSKYTLKLLLNFFCKRRQLQATVMVTQMGTPTILGGLRRDEEGHLVGVITKSDMEKAGISSHEVLCGAFCFGRQWIHKHIDLIPKSLVSGEYSLPGIIKVAADKGDFIGTFKLPCPHEWASVNTLEELRQAERLKLEQINARKS